MSERAIGPVLTSRFQEVLNHCVKGDISLSVSKSLLSLKGRFSRSKSFFCLNPRDLSRPVYFGSHHTQSLCALWFVTARKRFSKSNSMIDWAQLLSARVKRAHARDEGGMSKKKSPMVVTGINGLFECK